MALKKKTLKKSKKKKKVKLRKILKLAFFIILFSSACALGTMLGTYVAIRQNLPSISDLEGYEPGIITYIFSDEGQVIGEYALQKRIEIPYEEIPEILKAAIIATEDPRFFNHNGIDYRGILRALKEDIKKIRRPRSFHGGSTISQQLVRTLLLHRKKTIRRKVKEWILALQLEKQYTKEEILTMYCNQFDLGHGAHGVEAASNLYFGKSVSELSLEEAALITGVFRGPYLYSPYRKPDLTLRRRNHVLNRMLEEGFIKKEDYEIAKAKPLNVLPLHRQDSGFAAYFKEEVRKYLEKNYGADALYNDGLRVYTTLNPTWQKFAEEALMTWLRTLDKRQGWRDDKQNLLERGIDSLEDIDEKKIKSLLGREEIFLESWRKPSLEIQGIIEAVVLSVKRQEATVRVKDYAGKLTNKDIAWTKTNNLNNLIKEGDLIHVKFNKIDEEKKELLVSLDQEPILDGAFLAIEPHTGQIKALVGGYSFKRSKWNNATQAMRQTGSAIKPMLYTAALENRYTPATIIVDEPTEFMDQWMEEPWSPPNYDQKYKGAVTLRKGLEESRNIVTAKILDSISPQTGAKYCRKFGITSPIYPYLSLSLGTFEVKLIELVSAFTTFPNKGIRMKPYFIDRIEDKEGNILEETRIEAEEVISPQIAYLMTNLLQGVIQRGTGVSASALLQDKQLAGKTGTTDEYTDAWFMGFSPSLCAGVWVGHDTKISIGERQSGAVAALTVWKTFFERIIAEEKKKAEEEGVEFEIEKFEVLPNISWVEIDRKTGLLATPICLFVLKESFLPGTEPDRFCSLEDHMKILDYYATEKKEEESR
ncbi:MAG: PBP1A family penicillin-binding protein [Candidatus Aminicenantes bacterium]|nr:MAG: PBP1A family penicillin-binding protein [Candidatus Aminicenantes bacterium]